MRKRTNFRDVRDALPDKAFDLAGRLGDGLRHAVPDGAGRWLHDAPHSAGQWLQGLPVGAGKWLQTGMALGAARTGARAAGTVARRHPVALAAAAIGIGAALYAVSRHRRKQDERDAFEGRSQRIRDRLQHSKKAAASDSADTDSLSADLGIGAGRPDDVRATEAGSRD